MNYLEEKPISCPYCGTVITVLIDCSISQQSYVEDCHICCQPMVLDVDTGSENGISVQARRENN